MFVTLLAIGAFIAAGMAWNIAAGIAHHVNMLAIRVDELERIKGVVSGESWIVTYRMKGMRKSLIETIPASNESDALRQLLVRGIGGDQIISLVKG